MSRTPNLGPVGLICLLLSLPTGTFAGHSHPGYQHAVDDLRLAQALLQRSNMVPASSGWQDEVTLTVDTLNDAMKKMDGAVSGGKAPALPRVDAHMPWAERLNQSLRLIERAEFDCSKEKDDSGNSGLKAHVFDLLDEAHTRLSVAIQTVNFDYNARKLPTRND